MRRISRSPSYLVRTPHSYCFRMNVPKDLQWVLERKELRYSLKTGYLGTAKAKARLMAGKVQLLFDKLRRNQDGIMVLPEDKIRGTRGSPPGTVQGGLRQAGSAPGRPAPLDDPSDHLASTEIARGDILREIATGDYWRVRDEAISTLDGCGIRSEETDESSEAFAKLCEALLRTELSGVEYHLDRLSGAYSDPLQTAFDAVLGRGGARVPNGDPTTSRSTPEFPARQGNGRVFPELKRINNRYSHYTSGSWFPSYEKRCGIDAERGKKTFHSFRHTVADYLKQNHDLPDHFISELLGHRNPSITTGRYGKRFDPRTLLEKAVVKLDYYGIDLSHLKNSRWVLKD